MINFSFMFRTLSPLILRCMRITTTVTVTQVLFSTFLTAHFAEGQAVTLDLNKVKIETAFSEIEKQAEVTFVYHPPSIEQVGYVTLRVTRQPLETILKELERQTNLTFKQVGNIIGVSISKNQKAVPISETSTPTRTDSVRRDNLPVLSVSGTVTDTDGEPLIGVNIAVEGSNQGAATDFEGRFELNDVSNDAILIVSYIGYKTQRVPLNGRTALSINLEEDSQTLDEIVVVGYGTQKKSSLTGSIAKIENKTLDQMPTGRLENALAGKMAGVSIVNTRNTPGSAPLIRIRGAGSIDAGNNPLIVIDGFPGGDLGQLNMNDVESIEVLKDASAAAIYGSRGAGGVILVTTKRGSGKPTLNFNTYYGMSSPILHDDWLTGEEWYDYLVKYQNREFAWAGGDVTIPMYKL